MTNTISQYARKKAEKSFSSLTAAERKVLAIYAKEWANPIKRIGGTTIDRQTIAKAINVKNVKTVSRANTKLRALGLIKTKARHDNSNITQPTSWWRQPSIQSVLHLFFTKYPIFRVASFSLSLLLSSTGFLNGGEIASEKMSQLILVSKRSAIKKVFNISHRLTAYQKREILGVMKSKIDKILSIEQALLKRGEQEPIDKYKLMAFSDECLEYCIGKMKFAKPKYPYRFFLATAFEWCRHENKEPDFILADKLRLEGIPEFKENIAKALASMGQTPTVRKEAGRTGYSHQPEEKRKSNAEIIQETKERHKQEQIAVQKRQEARNAQRAPAMLDPNNPYAKILVNALLKQLQEAGFETEEGMRIRKQLEELGVPL